MFTRKNNKTSVKALVRSAATEESLRAAVSAMADLSLSVVQGTIIQHGHQLAGDETPDMLVVDIDLDDPGQMTALQQVVRNGAAGVPVIATSSSASVEGMRQLMQLQIADFIPQPLVAAQVASVIESTLQRRRSQSPSGQTTKVFTFIKPAGGMGSTTLAIQTAFDLAHRGKGQSQPRVCLVDLDLQYGTSAIYLDLDANLKITEIASNPQRLDSAMLASMMSRHAGGVDVLAAPSVLANWDQVTSEIITRLLEVVCQNYDYVVIDTPNTWMSWSPDVLAGSDVVLMVTVLSVAGVRQARQLMDVIHSSNVADSSIHVVLNRFHNSAWSSGLRAKEAERALGRKVDFFISNDYKLVSQALNQGVPIMEIKRRSKIEKQVGAMVSTLLENMNKSASKGAK